MSNKDETNIVLPEEWIPARFVYAVNTSIIILILIKEYKKRKQASTKFTTKSLQYLSSICMIAALLTNVLFVLPPFNGFCFVKISFCLFSLGIHASFMSFYQLYRLYYCFSNKSIHSTKGYPKGVFNIMTCIGIFVIASMTFIGVLWNDGPYIDCGINSKFEFYYDRLQTFSINYRFLSVVTGWIYLVWDATTLLLYYYKIRQYRHIMKEKHEDVYTRVLSILYRIFILTLFYQLTALFMTTLLLIISFGTKIDWMDRLRNSSVVSIITLSMCISMYLMMDHNKSEYIKFLKILKRLKLNLICCGSGILDEQILDLQLDHTHIQNAETTENVETTKIDTRDISLPPDPKLMVIQPSEVTITQQLSRALTQ